MAYIKQKTEGVITILNTQGYDGDLSQHPVLLTNSDLFEFTNEDLPEEYQIINFDRS